MIATCELPPMAKHLVVTTPHSLCFHMVPKIHKPNNPGHPIVSACCCPTENIPSYFDEVMAPFVRKLPNYFKETSFRFNNSDPSPHFLFTINIKSLWTVIPNHDGLQVLSCFLDERTVKEPTTYTLTCLAELVLNLNAFSFNNQHHR